MYLDINIYSMCDPKCIIILQFLLYITYFENLASPLVIGPSVSPRALVDEEAPGGCTPPVISVMGHGMRQSNGEESACLLFFAGQNS